MLLQIPPNRSASNINFVVQGKEVVEVSQICLQQICIAFVLSWLKVNILDMEKERKRPVDFIYFPGLKRFKSNFRINLVLKSHFCSLMYS